MGSGKIPVPALIGAIVVALCLVVILFWRTMGDSVSHEKPAPAKDPATNPMFNAMRKSMQAPGTQSGAKGGSP